MYAVDSRYYPPEAWGFRMFAILFSNLLHGRGHLLSLLWLAHPAMWYGLGLLARQHWGRAALMGLIGSVLSLLLLARLIMAEGGHTGRPAVGCWVFLLSHVSLALVGFGKFLGPRVQST
jgi:hypothetical protein